MIRIFRILIPTSVLTLFSAEILLIVLCYIAACYMAPDVGEVFLLYESGFARIALAVVVTLEGMYLSGLYSEFQVRSRLLLFQQLCLVGGITFMSQALVSYVNTDWATPRRVMILANCMIVVAVFGSRMLFLTVLRNSVGTRRILFLGTSPTVDAISQHLLRTPELQFTSVQCVQEEEAAVSTTQMLETVEKAEPNWIVIGNRDQMQPAVIDDFLELRFGGVEADDSASFYEDILSRVCTAEIRPRDLIFGDAFHPSDLTLQFQWLYSSFIAGILVLLSLPAMIVIALLVKLTSKGPIFVRHRCVGLNEEPFTRYRFSCTRPDGTRTFAGQLLEDSRLDRLPVLLNVFLGHMSLVGPRPVREELYERLKRLIPYYAQRQVVRPGLTGWTDINSPAGRLLWDEISQFEYDLYYVKNISPSFDLFIVLRRFKLFFSTH